MSLTYNLKFKIKIAEKQELQKLIKNHDNKIFIISDILTPKFNFIESSFGSDYINLELKNASYISFDIIKKDTDSIL